MKTELSPLSASALRVRWFQILDDRSAVPALVTATNWMTALGAGLRILGLEAPGALSSERAPDGAILIRDQSSGHATRIVAIDAPPPI